MSTTHIELKPVHWDVLKLIRTLCYEGLPRTRRAFVDPNDRWLPRWQPVPNDAPFVLPSGVPEPFVRACFFCVPFDDGESRWGKDGRNPGPVLRYLIDRGLLDVVFDNRPLCGAFTNPFNDSEILSTICMVEAEDGHFYVWQTPVSRTLLHEQHDSLVTPALYPVLKLTERAHRLLDGERITRQPMSRVLGQPPDEPLSKTATDVNIPNRARKAGEQYRQAAKALGVPDPTDREAYEQLAKAMEVSGEKGDLATFQTWQRNLREYRRRMGQQKNKPRAGRTPRTGTAVPVDQIEPAHLPTSIRSKHIDQ